MKNLFKSSMLVAIVAAAFVGCSKDATSDVENVTSGNTVTVNFDASVEDETRATLTPNDGETAFAAAWEDDKDEIGIYVSALDENADTYEKENVKGTRAENKFEATFAAAPAKIAYAEYCAYYPHTTATGNLINIPFGKERKQNGNNYNSAYDIMISDKVVVENATAIGKDAAGNAIVFPMKRQTAIAYFHFTTDDENIKAEKVVSAKLSVTGNDNIAAETIAVSYKTDNTISLGARNTPSKTITITFDAATAPTAADFTAWFNVLPCTFESMTLELETENYTAKILRNGAGEYAAGKLYKVSGNLTKWQPKTEDYSGTYLILAKLVSTVSSQTNNGYYFYLVPNANADSQKAERTVNDLNNDYSDIVKDDNAWVIEKKGDKYIISSLALRSSQNRFIGEPNASKNYAKLVAEDSAEYVNITKKDDGTYLIKTTTLSTAKCFALNKNSGQERFAFYSSGNQCENLVLIPYVSTPKIAPSVSSVNVSPVAGSYEDITYNTPGFETTPVVTATCDSAIVTAVEVVGNTIKYTVSANADGKERTGTITLSADGAESVTINVIQQSNVLTVPTNLSASGTVDAITASWNKVEHATAYAWELYKGTDKETGTLVNDVDGKIVTNDNGVTLTITKKDASPKFEVGQYVLYVKSTAVAPFVESDPAKSEVFEIKEASSATEEIIYSTEFNYPINGSAYNSSAEYTGTDSDGKTWGIVYGNWNGSNCAQLRVYKAGDFGSVYTKFDLEKVTKVSYKAKVSNNALKLNTYYSTDGGNSWIIVDDGKALTTSLTEYSFTISATGEYDKVRIKFEVSGQKPSSGNYQLTIDDVSVYGMK